MRNLSNAQFSTIWETANGINDVAAACGATVNWCYGEAARLRKAGVPLRYLRHRNKAEKPDVAALTKLVNDLNGRK